MEIGDFRAEHRRDGTYRCEQVSDLRRYGVGSRTMLSFPLSIGPSETPRVGEIEGRQRLTPIGVLIEGGTEILASVTPNGMALVGHDNWRDHLVGARRRVSGWKPATKDVADALARPGEPR
jgi:hypothetical protein